MSEVYDIQKTFYKVSDFISWKKANNLNLSPEFQRRSVWKQGAKSYLIDTIYRGLPIPIIFLRDLGTNPETYEPQREVIDGQQRLRTVISYIAPELLEDFNNGRDQVVIKKNHNRELYNKQFKDLDKKVRERILNYQFSVHILPSSVDDREIIQIFRRMNSTNYLLKRQELRNAEYFGEFKTLVYRLAAEQLNRWRDWNTFSEDDFARMNEVEFTSECIIMMCEGKIIGKTSAKIDEYYKKNDEVFPEADEIEKRYHAVMDFIDSNFSSTKTDFVFFKKTILYTFIAVIYDQLFGINTIHMNVKEKSISTETIGNIKKVNDYLKNKQSPKNILEATDRRTTNPKERNLLFNYIKNSL